MRVRTYARMCVWVLVDFVSLFRARGYARLSRPGALFAGERKRAVLKEFFEFGREEFRKVGSKIRDFIGVKFQIKELIFKNAFSNTMKKV